MTNFSHFKISKNKKIRFLKIHKKKGAFIVFLHGFMSDLDGKKPKALFNFSKKNKLGFFALEYSGHGRSFGKFTDGNISKWSKETSLLVKKIVKKNDIIKTKCGHFFHQYCIQEWYKENLTCPICRDYITKRASFQLDVVFSFHTYSVQIQVPTRHASDVDYVVSKLYKEVFVHNEISTLLNHNEYTLKIRRI